jgi:AcrR family transcriptional regulator
MFCQGCKIGTRKTTKRMQARRKKIDKTGTHELAQGATKVEAILKGAMQEFLVHGYAATSMDRVTFAAGVSKTTVYSNFRDKEQLFIALVKTLVKKSQGVLCCIQQDTLQGNPSDVLKQLATNFLNGLNKSIDDSPEILDLIRLIIGESGRFPMLAQIMVRDRDKPIIELVTNYLNSHPELKIPDCEAAARIFLGSLVHFAMVKHILHCHEILPMEQERLIETLVYFLTMNQNNQTSSKYSAIKEKSSRRQRSSTGKFESDYKDEKKNLRSIRVTDTAWEQLDKIAKENNLSRSELIEIFARKQQL